MSGAVTARPLLRVVRVGAVSVLWRPRGLAVVAALAAATVLATAVHLSLGGTSIDLLSVLRTMVGDPPDARTQLAVVEFRMPRTIAAIVAGTALAVAGAITQTIARNPLASPDILGVTSGASLGAVGVLVLAGGGAGGLSGAAAFLGLPAAAFLGGLIAGVAVYLLAYRGAVDGYRLVLVGLGISWLAASLVTWLLTLGDVTNAAQALTWMTGSLNAEEWAMVGPLAAVTAVLVVLTAALARVLALTGFGEETTVALGVRTNLVRSTALLCAVLLASLATVLAGPVGFVALAAPQIARLLVRSATPPLAASALVGALMMLLADVLTARLSPVPLPVGIGTAVLGVPYLVWLLIVSQRRTA
ncbi:iron chelate uptake ABC transporter family permease subunit [Microbacterium sp. X-17]|uniref:FecCD family ABC transporter permease n=1 Tax=Microbacterium sp. X-17 TaxID=3144404 RepID=UPI0031F59B8B